VARDLASAGTAPDGEAHRLVDSVVYRFDSRGSYE
jgi:hypothetical protein